MTRSRTLSILTASAALLVAGVPAARATVLLNETFDYPDGELGTASGGVWLNHSGTGGQTIANNQLVLNDGDFVPGGNSTSFTGDYHRAFTGPAATSGTVYAAFDVTVSTADAPFSTFADGYFAHFAQATNTETSDFTQFNFSGRVTQLRGTGVTQSDQAASYKLGVINTGNSDSSIRANATLFTDEFVPGTTYRYVTAFNFDDNTARLWVNPVDASSPSVFSDTGDGDPTSLGYYAFRLGSGGFDGDETIDNLVVATTFAEAAAVPEPASMAVLGLAGLALLRRRRA